VSVKEADRLINHVAFSIAVVEEQRRGGKRCEKCGKPPLEEIPGSAPDRGIAERERVKGIDGNVYPRRRLRLIRGTAGDRDERQTWKVKKNRGLKCPREKNSWIRPCERKGREGKRKREKADIERRK